MEFSPGRWKLFGACTYVYVTAGLHTDAGVATIGLVNAFHTCARPSSRCVFYARNGVVILEKERRPGLELIEGTGNAVRTQRYDLEDASLFS